MKYVRFLRNNKISYGIWQDEIIKEIEINFWNDFEIKTKEYLLNEVILLAPCQPSKIVSVGLNYRKHAEELKMNVPKNPILFIKPPSAIIGPEGDIVYPTMSKRVDYEAELGIVIKKKASHIRPGEVGDYILGYTCVNDVTARDLQKDDIQWTRAKSFDTFAPIGPCIVDELDGNNLGISLYLNGEKKQDSSTSDFLFKIEELVSFISDVMTLFPGDVISTGTPPGVGPMQPGDVVEVVIEHIGRLRNKVVAL